MTGTLWICGKAWAIHVLDEAVVDEKDAVNGITDKAHHKILISTSGVDGQTIRSTMLHELGHAILSTVANTHPSDEEECVQAFETGMYSALTDTRNEWFWAAVRGESGKKKRRTSLREHRG